MRSYPVKKNPIGLAVSEILRYKHTIDRETFYYLIIRIIFFQDKDYKDKDYYYKEYTNKDYYKYDKDYKENSGGGRISKHRDNRERSDTKNNNNRKIFIL